MHYIESMEIRNSTDDLFKVFAGFLLFDFALLDNLVKQLSFLNVIHHQE